MENGIIKTKYDFKTESTKLFDVISESIENAKNNNCKSKMLAFFRNSIEYFETEKMEEI